MKAQTGAIRRSVIRTAAIVLIASLFAGTAGAEIVGPDRRITWTPGVSGGIPNRTNRMRHAQPVGRR